MEYSFHPLLGLEGSWLAPPVVHKESGVPLAALTSRPQTISISNALYPLYFYGIYPIYSYGILFLFFGWVYGRLASAASGT